MRKHLFFFWLILTLAGVVCVAELDANGHAVPVNMRFIDRTGNVVIRGNFDDFGPFAEGLAMARVGDKMGYLDKQGNLVIPPQFSSGGDFSEGLAAGGGNTDHWGQTQTWTVPCSEEVACNPLFKYFCRHMHMKIRAAQ